MAKRQIISLCLALLITLLGATGADASSPERCDSLYHRLSVELRSAYNSVAHFSFRSSTHPVNSSIALHARYAFTFSEDSRLGQLYPTAYQGIGVAAYTFWEHELTGTPMAIYLLQGAKIANLTPRLAIGYEWNFGLSWGWHPNDAMNSRCNVMINVALPLTWRIAPRWELAFTPDYTHFSNGDTSFSNSGANMFGLRVGATYLFDDAHEEIEVVEYISPAEELQGTSFRDHMVYDLVFYGGWRADRFVEDENFYLINKPLPIVGLAFQPSYLLNDHFAVGLSLDIQANSSLNLYDGVMDDDGNTISYSRPPLWKQTEVGISLRGEIRAPIFTIGAGFGFNFNHAGYDMSPFYTSFSLKAFLHKNLFLHIGYRFNSTQYTHNLMYGLGVRF